VRGEIRLAAKAIIILALFALANVARAAVIQQVSLVSHDSMVEVDFMIRGPAPQWHLRGQGQELWIELEHARMARSAQALSPPLPFPLSAVLVQSATRGNTRLVFRVHGKIDYAVAFFQHELIVRIAPFAQVPELGRDFFAEIDSKRRIVQIEPATLHPADQLGEQLRTAEHSNVAARPPAIRSRAVALDVRPAALSPFPLPRGERPLVVIDAGHGGYDPGTQSANGAAEKNLALAIASRLSGALEARGIRVKLTRDSDVFLNLAERTQIANRAGADLFISIHLNSSPDRDVSGIETYYLNNTTDRATIRLARMENQEGLAYGAPAQPNLDYILANLQQDYKANESASLARMIEFESASTVESVLGMRVNALGAKKGPFYVLVGARMPSVLVECGFLSNPSEAERLSQSNYQQAVAGGIAAAVMHYFNADAAVGNL
jgi:N-acetylmuramoyl-L-alanine amidase